MFYSQLCKFFVTKISNINNVKCIYYSTIIFSAIKFSPSFIQFKGLYQAFRMFTGDCVGRMDWIFPGPNFSPNSPCFPSVAFNTVGLYHIDFQMSIFGFQWSAFKHGVYFTPQQSQFHYLRSFSYALHTPKASKVSWQLIALDCWSKFRPFNLRWTHGRADT